MITKFFKDGQSTLDLLDRMSDAVVMIDAQGIVLAFNQSAQSLFGYSASTVLGENVKLLMPEKERVHHDGYLSARKTNSTDHVVGKARPIEAMKSNGETFPAHISITQFDSPDGPVFLGLVRDLSDMVALQKQTERENERLRIQRSIENAVQESRTPEVLMRSLLVTLTNMSELKLQSKAGVFIIDRPETAGSSSLDEPEVVPDAELGLRLAMTEGVFSDEFLEKEKWIPYGACLCGRVAQSGQVIMSNDCFTDCRHEHKFTGMTAHGHYIIPITASRGTIAVVFLYTDTDPQWDAQMGDLLTSIGRMTGRALERLWTEQQNAGLLNKLNLALVGSNATLVRMDLDQNRLQPISGVLDAPDVEVTYIPDRRKHIPVSYHKAIDHARAASEQITIPFDLPTGRRWLNITFMHETYENGRLVQYNLTRDVTDEMAVQEERDQLILTLKETSVKRSRLFGMVAHELRTPVAAIQMMASEESDADWLEHRKSVLRSSQDLLHTLDDMRLLINPELKRPVRPEPFSVQDMNASVASSVASIVASSGVHYQQFNAIALPQMDMEFTADTYRVRVVITNLVKNACLHSQGSHVWMLSGLYMDGMGRQYIEWLVLDNGVGIPEDQIDRLFEPGERGDSKAEGTGFGLYIAKNWIEEIDGQLLFKRRAEGGSEFAVRVPLIPAQPSNQSIDTSDSTTTELDALLARFKVLMVEDEAMLRMLGQKLLSRMVGSIDTAENGIAGLDLADDSYDLILTDYFMPQMSGVKMTEALRASGYTGVIIGVTAATIGEQRDELIQAGADLVLPKPITAELFRDAISQLLEAGRFK